MKAMILAAGRGQRLRPLTDTLPKPLVEVGGKSLIERHLDALSQAGFREVVINLAWLGDRIEQTLGDGRRWGMAVRYSREPEQALETAGGIIQALPWLGGDPFVVISGDILCDFPLRSLQTLQPPVLGHLVMVDNPAHHPRGDFHLGADGRLSSSQPALTFSGIAVLSPEMFHNCEPGRRPLRPLFDRAAAAGQLTGEHHQGLWSDVGTPERLVAIRQQLGRKTGH